MKFSFNNKISKSRHLGKHCSEDMFSFTVFTIGLICHILMKKTIYKFGVQLFKNYKFFSNINLKYSGL